MATTLASKYPPSGRSHRRGSSEAGPPMAMSREDAARISGKIDEELKVCCGGRHLSSSLTLSQRESARQKEARKREVKGEWHVAMLWDRAYAVSSHASWSGGLR